MKNLHWLGILFLVALTACNVQPISEDTQPTAFTEADNGSRVMVEAGEEFIVTLESNPTTGYSWQIVEMDQAMLNQRGDVEFQQGSDSDGLVGAGGAETFRFVAVSPGETILTLGYFRPWEDEPLQKTFTITVAIE